MDDKMLQYVLLAEQAVGDGDDNFCVPMVYSLLTGKSVRAARSILNQKVGRPAAILPLMNQLKTEGYKFQHVQGKNGRGLTRNMPNKLPRGTYMLISNNHVCLMKDGEIADWSGFEGNRNKRIVSVYRISETKT